MSPRKKTSIGFSGLPMHSPNVVPKPGVHLSLESCRRHWRTGPSSDINFFQYPAVGPAG